MRMYLYIKSVTIIANIGGIHMKYRTLILLLSLSFFTFIIACSKEEDMLEDRLNTYVSLWQEHEFSSMYEMLSTKALDTYTTEDFIERYENIYEDLNVSKLDITFASLTKDDFATAKDEGQVTVPFKVDMDTIAGEITFDYEATFVLEEKNDEKNWYVDWDPGFIFPELKDGGEIKLQTEMPERGEILDRNKMPLAMNDIVYEVGVVPKDLKASGEAEKEKLAQLLNTSVEAIDEELNADWVETDLFVPLGKIPKKEEKTVNQMKSLESVQFRETTGRIYPVEEAAGHMTGYIGPITAEELEEKDSNIYSLDDIVGKSGLERLFDKQLKGEKGVKIIVTQEDDDEIVLAEKEVKNGENIELTIDVNVQEELYDAYEDKAGTAVAIDPETGETLALVSSPAFDPNEFVYGNIERTMKTLENDNQKPLINRFTATFAPGSVLKPITAAVGLKEGTIDPDEGLEIEGLTWNNGEGWGDFQVHRVSETDKPVDLKDALIRSDNIYFAMQAVDMGSDAFVKGFETFGFEDEFPFTYPMTESTISREGTIDNEVLLANTSYGQGEIEMSSLHLATAYTPILNGGDMIKPTLLLDEETGEVWKEQLLSEEHAEMMQDILKDVVEKGTAQSAKREEFPISGKTGTAELKLSEDESGKENGWFVGYPTDDQDLLIAMMIEGVEDLDGSSYVADKVADVLVNLKK